MNNEDENAQRAIKRLFDALKIERVILVDDYYSVVPIETVISLCEALGPERAAQIINEPAIDFTLSRVDWRGELNAWWQAVEISRQRTIFSQLQSLAEVPEPGASGPVGDLYTDRLPQLLSGYEWRPLPPDEWEAQKGTLIKEAEEKGTLFLFDYDLENSGGSWTATAGADLIRDLLNQSKTAMCGLLSGKYSPDQVDDELASIRTENRLEEYKDRFLLIAKADMGPQPLRFALRLKLTAISTKCDQLKEEMAEAIRGSVEAAVMQLDTIDLYTFDEIVFRSSYVEGIWEPDTLVRLFSIFHRLEVLKKARDSKVANVAALIRSVSNIAALDRLQPSGARKIQHLEMYDEADLINSYYAPTELGDMFRITSGPKQGHIFILLAQPCDLVIRWQHPNEGTRRLQEATIVEIKANKSLSDNQELFFELKYLEVDELDHARYVRFGSAHMIDLNVLDLCALNGDGVAMMSPDSECPAGVIPPWQFRYKNLARKATAAIEEHSRLESNKSVRSTLSDGQRMKWALGGYAGRSIVEGSIDVDGRTISFGCQRIGRVRQPWSGSILVKFAHYLSRVAFEHDIASLSIHQSAKSQETGSDTNVTSP